MDSNQQPGRLSPWSATFHERRTALFIAIVCIVLIAAALLAPQWFKSKDNPPVTATATSQENQPGKSSDQPTYRISEAPTIAPVTAETPVARAAANPPEPKPTPKVVASTPPEEKKMTPPPAKVEAARKPVTTHSAPVAQTPPGYFVQVGAFKDKAHANQLRRKLTASGFNCRLVDRGNGLHGVWIGPESSRSAAEKLQQELKSRLHMQGFVTHSG